LRRSEQTDKVKVMDEPKYQIVQAADYLNVYCAKDGEICTVHYGGLDPSIPVIEIVCPRCGSDGAWKVSHPGNGWHQIPEAERKHVGY
jgi:hypothetical protein